MNYKIRVNSEAESKDVQGLFFELGYKWFSGGNQVQHLKQSCSSSFGYLVAWSSGCFTDVIQCGCGNEDAKEITLPDLRDMVVLKRNNTSDATHENSHGQSLLKVSNGWYIFNTLLDVWEWNGEYLVYQPIKLKPITKEPTMKEYLNKLEDGTYKLVVLDSVADGVEGLIEIPEGAFAMSRGIGFYKMRGDEIMVKYPDAAWRKSAYEKISTSKGLAWRRETLNDKVASAEVARQEFIGVPFSDLPEFNFGAVEVADVVDKSNVEQTLSDRESTYGSFKDVAVTTRNIMNCIDVDSMNAVQQEALHMICSKLARIANGNPYHVDSWHDIAGYASLVVKDINGNP